MSTRTAKGNKATPRGHTSSSRSADKTRTLSLRVPIALHEKLVAIAARERRSLNSQMLVVVEAGMRANA
ncbi:DNA-binding-regulatory protein [Microcystis phage vB_MaeS-yong1]|nr:DNA-binding-regulatory protein [Microcystis phage vB_MaeS-yong1]